MPALLDRSCDSSSFATSHVATYYVYTSTLWAGLDYVALGVRLRVAPSPSLTSGYALHTVARQGEIERSASRTRCCAEPYAPPSAPNSQHNPGIRRQVSLVPRCDFLPSGLSWLKPTLALPLVLAAPPFHDEHGFNASGDTLPSPRARHIAFDVSNYILSIFTGLFSGSWSVRQVLINIACVLAISTF